MSYLIIAAHPDDEVLGCGGTIALLSAKAHVNIAVVSQGMTSRNQAANMVAAHESLHNNLKKAASILNANVCSLPIFPDNKMDTVPLLDVAKHIEMLIQQYQPHTVFTHHGGDLNIDHSITFRAALTACRPRQGHVVKRFYTFETLSSTEWSFDKIAHKFSPNTFVDISSTLEKKIDAMEMYETESAAFPHPRSAKAIRALAHTRGATAGMQAAEAFELIFSRTSFE